MDESLKIKELKRRLNQNKDKFRYDIQYICNLFGVEGKEMIKEYDSLSNEMVKHHIEMDKVEKKINDVSYKFEKLKVDFIANNKIDLRDKILSNDNGSNLLNEIWKSGFISNDMFEVIKDELWRHRMRKDYELPKWM